AGLPSVVIASVASTVAPRAKPPARSRTRFGSPKPLPPSIAHFATKGSAIDVLSTFSRRSRRMLASEQQRDISHTRSIAEEEYRERSSSYPSQARQGYGNAAPTRRPTAPCAHGGRHRLSAHRCRRAGRRRRRLAREWGRAAPDSGWHRRFGRRTLPARAGGW